jgi:hypothetical protein
MDHQDDLYTDRARMLAVLCRMAKVLGMRVGLGRDPREKDPSFATIVFVELEHGGQVSWPIHTRDEVLFTFLPPYEGTWDGHGILEKWKRCDVFARTYAGQGGGLKEAELERELGRVRDERNRLRELAHDLWTVRDDARAQALTLRASDLKVDY